MVGNKFVLNYIREWRSSATARCQESGFDMNCMLLSQSTEEGLMVFTLSMVALVTKSLQSGALFCKLCAGT